MTDREEAAQRFEAAGWAIREKPPRGEEGTVGEAGRYAIRTTEKLLGTQTVYELHDEELNMKAYAHKVPSPGRAAELLEEYGAPAEISDVTPGQGPDGAPGNRGGSVALPKCLEGSFCELRLDGVLGNTPCGRLIPM